VASPRNIKDLDLRGKKALIRVDFNVPIKNGAIQEDTRIKASLPTIRYALEHGATVILMSHLGRPKGKTNLEFTLKPVAEHLSTLLGKPVPLACPGLLLNEQRLASLHPLASRYDAVRLHSLLLIRERTSSRACPGHQSTLPDGCRGTSGQADGNG